MAAKQVQCSIKCIRPQEIGWVIFNDDLDVLSVGTSGQDECMYIVWEQEGLRYATKASA